MLCIISFSVHFTTCLETWLTECCVSYPFQFFSPLSKVKDEPRDDSLEMVDGQNSQRSKDSSFINMTAGANDDASHHVGHDEKAPLLPI
ncbi:hypothetical protein NC652_020804 [Populus alba x Populus x berolinensis]|nr:hypothetical protein NC652_020804 [Populus alba x Populus x berolinensis]